MTLILIKTLQSQFFQDQKSGHSFLKQIQKENMDKINIRVEKKGFLKLLRLCVNMCPPPPTLLGYLGQVPSYFLSCFCLCAFLVLLQIFSGFLFALSFFPIGMPCCLCLPFRLHYTTNKVQIGQVPSFFLSS